MSRIEGTITEGPGSKPLEPESTGAPVIADPGGAGWPAEPKVTQAEELLYGEYAPIIRKLGEAAVAASEAYSYTCRRHQDAITEEDRDGWYTVVQTTWQLYENARAVHREVAERAVAIVRHRECGCNVGLPVALSMTASTHGVSSSPGTR